MVGLKGLTEWAEPLITKWRFKDLADPRVRGNFDENQLKQCINVAAFCVQSEPENRPTMKVVVSLLKGYDPRGKVMQTRIKSVKYKEELLELDQTSDGENDGGGLEECFAEIATVNRCSLLHVLYNL